MIEIAGLTKTYASGLQALKDVSLSIGKGENAGKKITYYNVARRLVKIGDWTGKAASWTIPADQIRADGVDGAVAVLQSGSTEKPGLMLGGATFVDPTTTWVDVQVTLGRDVVVEPGTQLRGHTTVADRATVGPDTTLTDCEIGWIILLDRRSEGRAELNRVDPAEALRGLLTGAFAGGGNLTEAAFEALGRAITSAELYRLSYSDLADAVDVVKKACR